MAVNVTVRSHRKEREKEIMEGLEKSIEMNRDKIIEILKGKFAVE